MLSRWLVGLGIDDAVWAPTVFTKIRDRLLTTEISSKLMAANLASGSAFTHFGLQLPRKRPSTMTTWVMQAPLRSARAAWYSFE